MVFTKLKLSDYSILPLLIHLNITYTGMAIAHELSRAGIQLLLEEPFYAHLLSGLLKLEDRRISTVAVGLHRGEQLALHVRPEFWRTLSAGHQQGVLKHELLHIAMRHLFLAKAYPHRSLFNVAADLVVNQYIRPERLPEGALRLASFPALQLQPKRELGYYYHALLQLIQEAPGSADGQQLQRWLQQEGQEWQQRHQLWPGLQRISRAEQDNLEQNLAQLLSSIARKVGPASVGRLPGSLQQYLQQLERGRSSVDWRRALRLFAAGSETTMVRNTIRRPSRRYGTVPGSKIQAQHKVLVAIDSSGSVEPAELSAFFTEIHHLWQQRAEVQIVECDLELQRTYPYRGQPPGKVQGRGGTNFDPPIQYANHNYRPDALVYFTDGYGPAPRLRSRCPVLWLITPGGIEAGDERWHQLPGQVIKMKETNASTAT